MSQLLEHAQRILESARGDEEIEVYVASGVDTEVQSYQGEVEELTTATSNGFGIRILNDGAGGARVGTAWPVRSTTKPSSTRFARPVTTRLSPPRTSSSRSRARRRRSGVTHVERRRVASTPLEEKIAMAIELERLVRGGDTRIRQVDSANYSDYVAEAAIASTTGIRASYARTGAYVSVEAIANDGGDDQTGWASRPVEPPRARRRKGGRDAIRRATRMLGAVKPKSFKCTAVFDPRPRQHFSRLSAEH